MLAGWLAGRGGRLPEWLRCWLAALLAGCAGWLGFWACSTGYLACWPGWLGWLHWLDFPRWLATRRFIFIWTLFGPFGFGLILGDTFGPCWALGLGPMGPSSHPVYGVPCNHPSCRRPFGHPVYGVLFHHPIVAHLTIGLMEAHLVYEY